MPENTNTAPAAFVLGDNGFSLFVNGKSFTVSKDNPNYTQLLAKIREKDWAAVDKLLDIKETVTTWLANDPGFKIEGGLVTLDGEAFSEPVSQKVLRMIGLQLDANPLLKFLRKVRGNPSNVAQRELLLFCVANGFGITDDGDIIAYKLVKDDFTDHYTGKFDNSVGKVVTMPRHQVDDRRDVTCSRGLHFAAFEYANTQYRGGRGKLVAIKVSPTDVVSIPDDYNNQKGRCCRYEVVSEVAARVPLPQQEVYGAFDVTGRDRWDSAADDDDDDLNFDDCGDPHCTSCNPRI